MAKHPYELKTIACVFVVLILNVHEIPGTQYEPTDNVHIPTNAYKYYGSTVHTYVDRQVTWNEASEICRTLYASGAGALVKIDSFEEQAAVRDNLFHPAPWIGLHWHVDGGNQNLVWADPSCREFEGEQFSNFGNGDDAFSTNERCFYMSVEDGLWKRSSCNARRPFVCEHQDVDLAQDCPSDTKNGFFQSNARVEAVAENGANHNKCTRNCRDVQGCFMVYPGNKECIMAISDDSETLFIKDICFASQHDTGNAASFSDNNNQFPETCQLIDTNFLTGGAAEATQGVEESSSLLCSASTTTVTSTVTESSPCVTVTTTVTESPIGPESSAIQTISLTPVIQQVTVTSTEMLTTTSTIVSTVLLDATPEVVRTTIISTLPVTLTTTAIVTASISQVPGMICDPQPDINVTTAPSSVDIHSLTAAIVESLKMEATSFSSYRRTKESVPDGRVSSKISGAVAISVLVLTFGTIVAMDITLLAPDLLKLTAKIASK